MNNNEPAKLLINVLLRALIALCAGFIAFWPVLLALVPLTGDGTAAAIIALIVFFTVFLYPEILSRFLLRFQNKA